MKEDIKYRINMIKKGEIPEGYKKEKIGIIPIEWKEVKFCCIFEEKIRKTNNINEYPLYSLTLDRGVTPKTERYERSFLVKNSENSYKIVDIDEFVYNPMNVRFGAVARNQSKTKISVSGYYNVFSIKNNFNKKYIENLLVSNRLLYLYNSIATGSLIEKKRVHFSQFLNFKIHMAPIIEQHKIAEIIEDMDRVISLKEQLIELKLKYKKGIEERILTGTVRVEGFNDEWDEVKLGDILSERKEVGYSHLELLAITSANGVVKRSEIDIKDSSSEDKSKYKRILPGDIGYNTMRMWQGVSGLSIYEGIVSPAYTVLKPNSLVCSKFISYLFKLPNVINLFNRYSQGIVKDTLNLKYENLKNIKVKIPNSLNEQIKISEILENINNEIEILQRELGIFKKQRMGIAQLILMGIVRVK